MRVSKRMLKWPSLLMIIVALAAVPLLVGLAGCGEDDLEEAADDIEKAVDEAAEDIEKAVDDATAHSVTVTGFTCPIPPDSDTGDAEGDNIFASVNVTIKNESDVEQVTGTASFVLEDEDGTRYDADLSYSGANAIGVADTIGPGEELSGVLIFEVPRTAIPKYLIDEAVVGEEIKIELPPATR